jgi:hypothetical protein
LDVLIGSTVVYRGQFGAARPGAARVRVVMYVAGMGCFRVVDGDGDGVPAVGDGDNGGVWTFGRSRKEGEEKDRENGDVEELFVDEPPWPFVFCFGGTPYSTP